MKKLLGIVTLICLASQVSADGFIKDRDVLLEAKAAYFGATGGKFRKIYHKGGGIYGAELTVQAWKNLYPWASVDYFTKSGSSIGLHDHTRVTLLPVALGLKYLFNLTGGCTDFYVGLGAVATRLHTNDKSPFVIHETTKWGWGGIAKAGFIFNLPRHFFIDIFGNYTYTKVHIDQGDHRKVQRHNADISGWAAGGGIGYRFNGPKERRLKNTDNAASSEKKSWWQIF